MKLILDLGNTQQKLAVFDGADLMYVKNQNSISIEDINILFSEYDIKSAIVSSVIHHSLELENSIRSRCRMLIFSQQTPIPILNNYKTPETLGKDRLSAVIAAHTLFPNHDVLVIDAGTCLKFDFINCQAEYLGGAISPGLQMRFRALHNFTGKLPLIDLTDFDQLIGKTTQESILSGVINGTTCEIDGIIDAYRKQHAALKVILSGGDAEYLANKLKNEIFAVSNIVLKGLNLILDYNENQQNQ